MNFMCFIDCLSTRLKLDVLYAVNSRLAAIIIAALFVASAPTGIQAAISITSLPYHEDFNQNDYSNIIWVTQGATHVWNNTGGYDNAGAARFTPPVSNGGEGYSGLGQFTGLSVLNGGTGLRQLNVRILIKHGPTFHDYSGVNKLMIFNRNNDQTRPMIMNRIYTNNEWQTYRACHGTWCYPNEALASDTLRIGSTSSPVSANVRYDQWMSVELEANLDQGVIRLYIYTADGQVSGLYSTNPFIDPNDPRTGVFSYVDIIGGYFNAHNSSANSGAWFMIDDLVIDDSYIGPPADFVVIPNSPTGLTAD